MQLGCSRQELLTDISLASDQRLYDVTAAPLLLKFLCSPQQRTQSPAQLSIFQAVSPGDQIQPLPQAGSIRIGAGLRTQEGYVLAQKCGVVRQTRSGKLWLEGRQKRYIPAEEDLVVGLIQDRRGENFLVDIGSPFPAQLPQLAFEGASRRNRPNLNSGDLVYARVITANRDMDPVLSCVDAQGRAMGFGPLKGGLVVECSLPHARALLAKPPGPVLSGLGSRLKFELAVGMNGRIWVHSADCSTTIRVCRLLVEAQSVPVAEQQQWIQQQL